MQSNSVVVCVFYMFSWVTEFVGSILLLSHGYYGMRYGMCVHTYIHTCANLCSSTSCSHLKLFNSDSWTLRRALAFCNRAHKIRKKNVTVYLLKVCVCV